MKTGLSNYYSHSQMGWVIICTMALGLTVALYLFLYNRLIPVPELLVIPGIISVLVLILFYRLKVDVDSEALQAAFGIGLIRYSYAIEDIEWVRPVKNSWLIGWGIRFSWDYMTLNVSGFNAVELKLKGRNYKVRIGTDEPDELVRAISLAKGA